MVAAALLAIIVALPIVAVIISVFEARADVWVHLAETRLLALSWNTIRLLAGVLVGAGVLGVGLAWLVAVHRFPGRRFFQVALVLPMAVPAYVVAFVMVGLLDFAGPVQSWLRGVFGPNLWLPEIRSYGGVVIAMSLVFYPYVFLLARAAFAERGASMVEAARSLGRGPGAAFWRLALPIARPAIAGGLGLVAMETLGDFGTVSIFNYDTFTTAVYRVWFGMFDRVAAGQIAIALMLFAFLLIGGERLARGRARYTVPDVARSSPIPLSRGRAWLATAACTLVVLIAFVVPAAVLVKWSMRAWQLGHVAQTYPQLVRNTAFIAMFAAVIASFCALVLAYGSRVSDSRALRALRPAALLGYAVPGSVIAVGVLLVLTWLDNGLNNVFKSLFGIELPMLLIASAGGLLFAYLIRFLAVPFQSVQAGLGRIPKSLDESARSVGASTSRVLTRIHAPLLRGSLATAMILMIVEVVKEMPVTMLIRPFGFETLAVEIWQRTSDGMWIEAAPPSLTILACGTVLVALVTRMQKS